MLKESFFNIFFLLFFLLALSLILDRVWGKIFTGKKYRIFVVPGVVIHEFSHILACLLTGAKIQSISLFSSEGGYVKYQKPKIPIFGQIFISFAPIIGGILMLIFLFWIFNSKLIIFENFNLSNDFLMNLNSIINIIPSFLKEISLSWQFFLFLYLVISVSVCLTPSTEDFKNAFFGIFIIVLLGIILNYFGFLSQSVVTILNKYLGTILIVGITFEFLALIFTLPIYFIHKILWKRFSS